MNTRLGRFHEDERGIALIIVMLVSMVILSLSVTIVKLADNEAVRTSTNRKNVEAAQTIDTGYAEFLAVLPTTGDSALCEDWDADTRESLGLTRAIEARDTSGASDGYPITYELELAFIDIDGNDLDCSTWNGKTELDTATITAIANVGTATANSAEVHRKFEMGLDLTAITGEGVDQAIYGASDVLLENNKNIQEDVANTRDADIYSGCTLNLQSVSSSNFQGDLIAGCDLTLDGSYTWGNVWAKGLITIKGGACVGIKADGACGYGDNVADWPGTTDTDTGWVVSSQGDITGTMYTHRPCVAANGTITKIASGPKCLIADWVAGPDPYSIPPNEPPAFFPSPYGCPAEAAAVSMMGGADLCDDPPPIDFPTWNYVESKWIDKGYVIRDASSLTGADSAAKCADAKTKIDTAATSYPTATLLDLRGLDCVLSFTANVTFNDDFAIITDGSLDWSGTAWTGAAGEIRTLTLVHPNGEGGGEAFCSTEADGVGTNGADAQDDFTMDNLMRFDNFEVFLYTPCHIQADNNSTIEGQMIAGTVGNAGNGGLAFRKVDVPGLGDPMGYNAMIVYSQELPHTNI